MYVPTTAQYKVRNFLRISEAKLPVFYLSDKEDYMRQASFAGLPCEELMTDINIPSGWEAL